MRIKFRNPPINELVIGVYFDRGISSFRSEHVGLFWSTIRKGFPVVRQRPNVTPPLFGPAGSFMIELAGESEVYPMPRFWLESEDGVTLMQIQKNAFLFNWRKREAQYPHYENVKTAFDENFSRFSRFIESEVHATQPALQIAELTYINLVESCEYWRGPQDTENVFPNFRLVGLGPEGTTPADFNQITSQRFAMDLTLTTSIRSGRSAPDADKQVLIFEFRAIGLLGTAGRSEADAWFERAHETIGECFTSMTNPYIQEQYWQPL
jgi:uncharacterized protein (TIGR04255 family)